MPSGRHIRKSRVTRRPARAAKDIVPQRGPQRSRTDFFAGVDALRSERPEVLTPAAAALQRRLGNASVQRLAMADRLGDTRFQTAQRQAVARRVRQVSGNRYLQAAVAQANQKKHVRGAMSRELAQQAKSPKPSIPQAEGSTVVQRWGGSDHQKLVREATEGSQATRNLAAPYADDMDYKAAELNFNVGGYVEQKTTGWWALTPMGRWRARHPVRLRIYHAGLGNAINHGEGGCYDQNMKGGAALNEANQQRYIRNAKAASAQGKRWDALAAIGDALHVAQDRGSHREGAYQLGHDNPAEEAGWDTDDPGDNTIGKKIAETNTNRVLKELQDILAKYAKQTVQLKVPQEQKLPIVAGNI